jgi:hypothetical protein
MDGEAVEPPSIQEVWHERHRSTLADHRGFRARRRHRRAEAPAQVLGGLTGFVAVNGVLWLIWVLTDRTTDGSIPWPAWVSAVWGFLLALDALRAFGRWPGTRAITDAEIERELRRRRGA